MKMKRTVHAFFWLALILGLAMPCDADENMPPGVLIPMPPFPAGTLVGWENHRMWRLGLTNHVEWAHEAFVSRNVAIIIRSATNSMDFALSLLNAGLPEEDRIPLSPTP